MAEENVCNMFRSYDDNMRSIRYHLNGIKSDHYLITEKKWDVFYAVDFSMIRSYIMGNVEILKQYFNDDEALTEAIQKQVGVDYLLTGHDETKLLLLPPWELEFERFLKWFDYTRGQAEEQLSALEILKDGESEHREHIASFVQLIKDNQEPPQDLIDTCKEIIFEHFFDLFILWLGEQEKAIKKIGNIIKRIPESIKTINSAWPSIFSKNGWFKEPIELESIRSDMFAELRRNNPSSNAADAFAIQLVEYLNNLFESLRIKNKKPNGVKKRKKPLDPKKKQIPTLNPNTIVCLASDTRAITRVLNWDHVNEPSFLDKKYKGKSYPVGEIVSGSKDFKDLSPFRYLRTPRTFLFELLFTTAYALEDKNVVLKEWQDLQVRYFSSASVIVKDLREKCRQKNKYSPHHDGNHESAVCLNCENYQFKPILKKTLSDFQTEFNAFENTQIWLNLNKIADSTGKKTSRGTLDHLSSSSDKKEFTKTVYSFLQTAFSSGSKFKEQLAEKRNFLNETIKDMLNSMPILALKSVERTKGQLYLQFLDTGRKLFDKLDFASDPVTKIVGKIVKTDFTAKGTEQFRQCLIQFIKLKKSNFEEDYILLQATLASICREFSFSLYLLKELLGKKDSDKNISLRYLNCHATYEEALRTGRFSLMEDALNQALRLRKDFPKEARAIYLYSKIAAVLIIRKSPIIVSHNITPADILSEMTTCKENLNPTPVQKETLLNNLAYCTVRFSDSVTLSDLKDAKNYLVELEEHMINLYSIPSNLDTIGYIYEAEGNLKQNLKDQVECWEKALSYYARVKRILKNDPETYDYKIASKHFDELKIKMNE
jgi:hypothetical protein